MSPEDGHGGRTQGVDFGSEQGRSDLTPAGVAQLRRGPAGSENAARGRKMPLPAGYPRAFSSIGNKLL